MTKQEETQLVPITESLAALRDLSGMQEIISQNLAGGGASIGALGTIKCPSGGAPVFVTENELDGVDSIKEFDALVCWFADRRNWWEHDMDDGDRQRPDCSSLDAKTGRGDPLQTGTGDPHTQHGETFGDGPVHTCATCPHNRFGKAPDDSMPWCKESRQMFLVRMDQPDVIFPSVLRAPATSLRNLRRYMFALAARGVPYLGAVHKFSLEPAKSEGGIDYSRIKMSFVRRLDADEVEKFGAYAESMRETFAAAATVD